VKELRFREMIIPQANRLNQVKEYYFSTKLQEIREMEQQGIRVLNLGIGNPDLAPSVNTVKTLSEAAIGKGNHGYQSYRGVLPLRKAIANWYQKTYKVALNAESEILPLMGSKEGIMHISMAFLNPGDEVLVPNPGYPTYGAVSNLLGAKIRTYNLTENNNWEIDIQQLEQSDLSKVKLMWINYPHMPTGTKASDELLEQLIALAKKHQFLICNDNPYSLILNSKPKSILSYEGANEVAIELNSLSKSHNMAGWRMGWVAGAEAYIDTILKVKSNMDSGMFLPMQRAAIEALNNTKQWHLEQNNVYKHRRNYVWEIMDILECTYDKNQVGLFVWAKVPEHVSDVETFLDELLHEAHVFITPGFIFGSNGERYIRASLCNKVEILKEAILRVKCFETAKKKLV
jgi:LL-diaminopimelate aminotransferase